MADCNLFFSVRLKDIGNGYLKVACSIQASCKYFFEIFWEGSSTNFVRESDEKGTQKEKGRAEGEEGYLWSLKKRRGSPRARLTGSGGR